MRALRGADLFAFQTLPSCRSALHAEPSARRPPSKRSTSPGLLAAPITHRRTARTGSLVRTCHRYDIERGVSSDDAIASRILRRRRGMPRRRLHRGPVPVQYNLRIINAVHAWRRLFRQIAWGYAACTTPPYRRGQHCRRPRAPSHHRRRHAHPWPLPCPSSRHRRPAGRRCRPAAAGGAAAQHR